MTTYQEIMLSICFGATIGYLISGLGIILSEVIHFAKRKFKSHKEKKDQAVVDEKEKDGDNL